MHMFGVGNRLRLLRRIVLAVFALAGVLVATIAVILGLLVPHNPTVAFDTEKAAGITYAPMESLVPGDGIPKDLPLLKASNCLDITCFKDRYYFAFRNAPFHFASKETRIIVVSSDDRKQWRKECEFSMGSDLREPRLLVFKDTLFLYFFQAGEHMLKFQPRHIYAAERLLGGRWTEPCKVFKPGYVVWRVKTRGEKAYMSVYHGADIYGSGECPSDIRLLTSTDGYEWEPISEQAQVNDVGAEEAEFEFDEEGNLVAVVREEVGGGSLVCKASRDDLSHWRTKFSPFKYDSSLMFRRGKEFYVIARRNVAGTFDRELHALPESVQHAVNFVHYSLTRKRTALYRVDVDNLCLVPLFDFPSKGDTAFAGLAPLDDHSYWLVNYSSPLEGQDWPWIFGQLLHTRIYQTVLTFPVARQNMAK